MTRKTAGAIYVFLTTLTFGCGRHWVRTENDDQIVWKKINYIIPRCQDSLSINYGKYCFTDSIKNKIILKLNKNNQFEFIIDSGFDCTPAYSVYGKGQFETNKDSITLIFDSIPNLKSTHTIDSIDNNDNTTDINFRVINEDQKELTDLNLSWGKPRKKGVRITSEFFSKKFNNLDMIKFQKNEKINFLRVEKSGYFDEDIDLSKIRTKDYFVQVLLRPKPNIQSQTYISNKNIRFKILTDKTIELQEEIHLQKGNCN